MLFRSLGEELDEGPGTITYNAVINCWSKSNRPEAPQRAFDILKAMIMKHKDDGDKNIRPDTVTFNSVLNAYAKQGDIEGANEVWKIMKNEPTGAKSNVQTYNILIDAWAKSGNKNGPVEVETILEEINKGYKSGNLRQRPDEVTYTAMIQCLQQFQGTEDRVRELKAIISKKQSSQKHSKKGGRIKRIYRKKI